jgi:hypothetical protein
VVKRNRCVREGDGHTTMSPRSASESPGPRVDDLSIQSAG